MLILTRKIGESVVIGNTITVKIIGIEGGQVKLGFDAPSDVTIYRQELIEAISNYNAQAAQETDPSLLDALHKKLDKGTQA